MKKGLGLRVCARCHAEINDVLVYRRVAYGPMYRRIPRPCSTCEFRELQLPMLEHARKPRRRKRREIFWQFYGVPFVIAPQLMPRKRKR